MLPLHKTTVPNKLILSTTLAKFNILAYYEENDISFKD